MAKIKWNRSAFEEIRRSHEIEARLRDEVEHVLAQVGEGYEGGVEPGATRSRGYVVTTTAEAMATEARDHALLRALGGGGS